MEGPTFQIALESALGGFVMQIRRVLLSNLYLWFVSLGLFA